MDVCLDFVSGSVVFVVVDVCVVLVSEDVKSVDVCVSSHSDCARTVDIRASSVCGRVEFEGVQTGLAVGGGERVCSGPGFTGL